jgi:hypothetical protein
MKSVPLVVFAVAVLACSSAGEATSVKVVDTPDAEAPVVEVVEPACGEIQKASRCKSSEPGAAVVRALVRFDPAARVAGKGKPTLALFLRHSFIVEKGEAQIGGRLHGYKRIPLTAEQLATGEVAIEIDMCGLGTAMWSEENGMFHLVAILDENDAHNVASADNPVVAQTPVEGELVKMVDVEVSCTKPSPCLALNLDCIGGTACTKFQPITSLACAAQTCNSESSFCKSGKH